LLGGTVVGLLRRRSLDQTLEDFSVVSVFIEGLGGRRLLVAGRASGAVALAITRLLRITIG
jgi:hypothetical protein